MEQMVILGETGTGKSLLVRDMQFKLGNDRVALFDALLGEGASWSPPDNDQVELVILDHIDYLPQPAETVREASAWCQEEGKALWLVAQTRETLAALGIELDDRFSLLNLLRNRDKAHLEFTGNGSHAWLRLSRFVNDYMAAADAQRQQSAEPAVG